MGDAACSSSSFNSLFISGVRSFGPESDPHTSTLNFHTPLTIIVGPNGSGKTTLVECLRYITTGDFPPDTKRGLYFVHDTKIAQRGLVRGYVKLSFKDVSGKNLVVTRAMSAKEKGGKVSFESDHSTISHRNPVTGKLETIPGKITDINEQMKHHLGALDSILSNVAFCHQEDSNWPLQGEKIVKEKFDAIFDSTKYVNTLKKFNSKRLEATKEVKNMEKILVYHKRYCDEFKSKRVEIKAIEAEQRQCNGNMLSENTQIKPVQEALNELKENYKVLREQQKKIDLSKQEMSFLRHDIVQLEQACPTPFSGSEADLDKQLASFEAQLELQTREKDTAEETLCTLGRQVDKLKNTTSTLQMDYGRLDSEKKRHEENVIKRDEFICQSAEKLQLSQSTYTPPISGVGVRRFTEHCQSKEESLRAEQLKRKEEADDELRMLDEKLQQLRTKDTEFRKERHMKQEEQKKLCLERESLTEEIQSVQNCDTTIRGLERRLARTEDDLKEFERECDPVALKKDLDDLRNKIEEREKEMERCQEMVNRLVEESGKRDTLRGWETEREGKKREAFFLLHSSLAPLALSPTLLPTTTLRPEVQKLLLESRSEKRNAEECLASLSRKEAGVQEQLNTANDTLERLQKELTEKRERVSKKLGDQELEAVLAELEEGLEKERNDKGTTEGGGFIFKDYIRKLNEKDECPLCDRKFSVKKEVDRLAAKLKKMLTMIPAKVEEKEKNISEKEKEKATLLELKPVIEDISRIQHTDIPSKSQEQRQLTHTHDKLNKDIEKSQLSVNDATDREKKLLVMDSDATRMDVLTEEIRQKTEKIERMNSTLQGTAVNLEIEKEHLDSLKSSQQRSKMNQKSKENSLREHEEKTTTLKKEQVDIRNAMLEAKKAMNDVGSKRDQLKKTEVDVENCQRQIELINQKMAPIPNLITASQEKLRKAGEQKEEKMAEIHAEIQKAKDTIGKVQEMNRTIESTAKSQDEFENCRLKIADNNQQLSDLNNRTTNLKALFDKATTDLRDAETYKRKLRDYKRLFQNREKLGKLEDEMRRMTESLGKWEDTEDIEKQRERLELQIADSEKRNNQMQGKMEELERKLVAAKDTMAQKHIRNAILDYRDKMIEKVTLQEFAKDLMKIYKALDFAITRFHEKKMNEINSILKRLWSEVYVGSDILEIKVSAEGESSGVGVAVDSKRKFNYKVMMKTTGDAWLDMRGRCSAGQKILACLLIRMAISEVFCMNCGILTLDEPTTNLDVNNIEKLGEALGRLIQQRSNQKNFQLVVITHDEPFVNILKKHCQPQYYYKVEKNRAGHTTLTQRTDFSALQEH